MVTEAPAGVWIRGELKLKIDRSVKTPWQEYSCFDRGCPTTAQKAHAAMPIGIMGSNEKLMRLRDQFLGFLYIMLLFSL